MRLQLAWAVGDEEEIDLFSSGVEEPSSEPTVLAPPKRPDAHGEAMHKRKAKAGFGRGLGKASRGKISTRSSAVTAEEKKHKRLTCSKCSKAGREAPEYDVTGHRAQTCPYSKEGCIETIDLTLESDTAGSDDEPLALLAHDLPPRKRKRRGGSA